METYTQEHITKFDSKITKTDSCWLWNGYCNEAGYGMVRINYRQYRSHRVSYEIHKGLIPDGLELDHLCRVRNCVNPEHLEAVTHKENLRRSAIQISSINKHKTHCRSGHEFNKLNTYHRPTGGRMCKRCMYLCSRKQSKKKQLARQGV